MTSLSQLSRRDVERLSAYLDGELSAAERARLEERIKEDPDLRSALEEMRTAVWLMRSMPDVKVPRNFILTPDMVGIRDRPRAYPIFQFATALATLALIVVVGIDFFSPIAAGRVASVAQEALPVEEAVGEMEEPSAAAALEDAVEEAPRAFFAEPEDEAGIGAAAPEEGFLESVSPTPCPDLKTEELERAVETETPMDLAVQATDVPPVAETLEQADMEAEPLSATPALTQAAVSGALSPTPPSLTNEDAQALVEPPAPPISPLRLIEAGLGAVAALLAAITFWMRKRGS
jgi:hypothetical protein